MLHEVVEVFHNVQVLVCSCHASHAVHFLQIVMQLSGEGLQCLVLAHVPEVSGLID